MECIVLVPHYHGEIRDLKQKGIKTLPLQRAASRAEEIRDLKQKGIKTLVAVKQRMLFSLCEIRDLKQKGIKTDILPSFVAHADTGKK